MKKTVTSLLVGCQPQELDGVLQNIDADLPEEANADNIKSLALQKAGLPSRRNLGRKVALIAACIALLAGILVGCYVAEQNEYNNAVKFFDLNELDAEGMTRSDIKRVYRDITTERFELDHSAQLLSKDADGNTKAGNFKISDGNTDTVKGAEISILNNNTLPDGGEIGSLNLGIPIYKGHGEIPDGTAYTSGDEIQKYVDGETVWRTKLPRFYDKFYAAGDRILIWTEYIYDEVHDYMHTSVVLIDDKDGAILWEKTLDSPYHFDEYGQAALTDDGRIAVLTIATDDRFSDEKVLVFRELNSKGEIVKEQKQPDTSIIFIYRLIPLSDGWLAEVGSEDAQQISGRSRLDVTPITDKFIKLDRNGKSLSEWRLTNGGEQTYEIAAIKEHAGKIYLSVQAKQNDSELSKSNNVEHLPKDMDSLSDGFTDELRDAARKDFSSVLFVFDPATNKPEEFYSVGGTMAGDFGTDANGDLVWRVGRIVKCGWAPYANSFQYYGLTRRYDYTFSDDGTKLKEEKTDIFISFRTL